jgi:hypothetical protein
MSSQEVELDIYEHGVLVREGGPPAPLRLVASTRMPIYSGYTLCIVDSDGTSLNERATALLVPAGPYTTADFWDESDVRYCILAMLYHLNRVVDRYVANCQLFESDVRLRTAIRGNVDDSQLFYEIDALISCARRVYESIRKVLWKYYNSGSHGRWRSIRKALADNHIPTSFRSSLNESWTAVGEKLTLYRDCIAHYDPLTTGQATCWMEPIGNRWGMTVKLPSNPESGRRSYNFGAGPDALQYCHTVACHLVGLAEELERQPAIAATLAA